MSQLATINSPDDLKALNLTQLEELATEIRAAILNYTSQHGGHVGPNLGMVETTIALHYVFNSPTDKLVFDVSHQSYAHKILTGRKQYFLDSSKFADISGFTAPKESNHDHFTVGHTSTSLSLACGLAKARDLQQQTHNVIAIIGDGSLSGGEALEGLNFASELGSNLIIIVNDNEMSIAENHGGLYQNLQLLRDSNGQAPCNMFKAFNLDYLYVANGNSIPDLISALQQVKDSKHPIVLHLHTHKGLGYAPAEQNQEEWHFKAPFDLTSGQNTLTSNAANYNTLTVDYLLAKVRQDPRVVVINAGTPGAIGFTPEKRQLMGDHFVDVGIAEEHAVAMSSALAKGGCKPIFWVLSPFVQRTYDQLSHDLALNKNPAVILVSWTGIMGNDATHLGCFDISLISNIPNLVHLAPTTQEEYFSMLDWAISQDQHPVVIRMPELLISATSPVNADYSRLNTFSCEQQGSEVAILAVGSFYTLGQQVVQQLQAAHINPTLVNPRFISGLDNAMLEALKANHHLVVTLEDGEIDGGFGQKVAAFYGNSPMKVLNFGSQKEFTDRVSTAELYQRYHLTAELILTDILNTLKA